MKVINPIWVRFYQQPLCFKNRDDLYLKGNWWMNANESRFGYTIEYCANSTENNNWCKTMDDTDIWLKSHSEYFMAQSTRVNSKMWAEDFVIEESEDYYPTT